MKSNAAISLVVAASSMCTMAAEVAGGRIVSGHIGQSLYTWTAVIGTFLAGLSAGNLAGGWLSCRIGARRTMVLSLILSALLCMAVVVVNSAAGRLGHFIDIAWPLRIFLHSIAVFLLPAAAFGMLSPAATEAAALAGMGNEGRFGIINSLGTVGALAGTFLSGFLLIQFMPTSTIFFALAACFLGLAAACLAAVGEKGGADLLSAKTATDYVHQENKENLKGLTIPLGICFIIGFCIMALELAAGRMLAADMGQSIFTWTSAIGVIFAGSALGNLSGSVLSTKFKPRNLVFLGAAISSAGILASPFIMYSLQERMLIMGLYPPVQILLKAALSFLPGAAFLGLALSCSAAMAARNGRRIGARSSALFFASCSIGSLAGTFMAGYLLFATVGTVASTFLLAGMMAAASIPAAPRKLFASAWSTMFMLLLAGAIQGVRMSEGMSAMAGRIHPKDPNTLYLAESAYSRIAVRQDPFSREIRRLFLDKLQHSEVNLSNPLDLRYQYEEIYAAAMSLMRPSEGDIISILLIGGGGYTFPRYVRLTFPEAQITVVEIDPDVTKAAYEAFGLQDDLSMSIYHCDGANFVAEAAGKLRPGATENEKFDFIFTDAVNDLSVPFHLTTVEFITDISRLLDKEGVYLMTLIDIYSSGRMLGAAVSTFRKVFRHVAVLATHHNDKERDTFVVIGSNSTAVPGGIIGTIKDINPDFEGRQLAKYQLDELVGKVDGLVLRNDFAPVERLMMPLACDNRENLAALHLKVARTKRTENNYPEALKECLLALEAYPGWYAAHHEAALNYSAMGKQHESAKEFQKAAEMRSDIPLLYYHLGKARMQVKDWKGAIEALQSALRLDPAYNIARLKLAEAYYLSGNTASSQQEWLKATEANENK